MLYTVYTYQDWLKMGANEAAARTIVTNYRNSTFFFNALTADRYFAGENPMLDDKWQLKVSSEEARDADGFVTRKAVQKKVAGNRISSSFLRRFILQQNQFLLGNGVTLDSPETKTRLGMGFDTVLQQIGEKALLHGVAYGYWNYDHLEALPAAVDPLSGACALLDEVTGAIGTVIQFWQLEPTRPLNVRVFEPDGVTWYTGDEQKQLVEREGKRPYKQLIRRDALGETVTGGENYGALPIFPLYANDEKRSELTASVRSKIDAYDRILSDYGDNLDRANDVYWVLNNFGGSTNEALQVVQQIQQLKLAMTVSDGSGGGSTAEPRTIEVPYAARQTALELLEKALYSDFMALSMDELTGGSLTNVAIQAAMTNINLKCDHYEWQCFHFVQSVLHLIGIDTEEIHFKRQSFSNRSETVQDIYAMRADIDLETALRLNPYIEQEDIDGIIKAKEAEDVTGLPNMNELQRVLDEGGDEA